MRIEDSTSLKHRSLSSLFWRMVERGGSAVVQMVVQVIMARLLLPVDFGALAIMLVFVNLGNVFVQSGLNTALIQADHVDNGSYSTVFWISIAIATLLYAGIFISAELIASFYGIPSLVWPLRAISLIFVINAYNAVQIAKVTRELDMRKTAIATLASVVISGVLGVGAAISGCGLWALVIQQLAYQLANCAVLAFQVSWRPKAEFRKEEARRLVGFGWKLLASGLIGTAYQSLSDLVIGASFTVESLGVYSQGKKYPEALSGAINGGMQPVALSAVAHVSNDIHAARRVTRRALKSSSFVVMPTMALFACLAPSLVPILMGLQWIDAIPYMQIVCIECSFLPIHSINLMALNAMGRSDLTLKLQVIKVSYGLANLLFCAFVLRDMWLLCCSRLLTDVISQMVNSWPNRVVLGYGYVEQMRDLAPGIGLSAVAFLAASALRLLPMSVPALVLLQVTAFLIVYLGMSKFLHVEAFEYLASTVMSHFHK